MTTGSPTSETLNAWAIYLQAAEEARRRGDRFVGTDHMLLALFGDPHLEVVLGFSLQQAREALDALDREALASVGVAPSADAAPLRMRPVPKKPRLRDVAQKDRLRMTPAAKKVLERASKSNRRRLYVTARQVLDQILCLQPSDPAMLLLHALDVDTSELRRRLDPVSPEN